MKFKKTIISIFIFIISCFTLVGLTGCNEITIGTLEKNYQTLQEIYTKAVSDGVFLTKSVDETVGETKYFINFGTELQKKIDGYEEGQVKHAPQSGYVELRSLYNVTFAISNEFVDGTIEWIFGRKDETLSKRTQSAVERLNSALLSYTSSLKTFLSKRETLVYDFNNVYASNNFSEDDKYSAIVGFKKYYGDMINKNVDFSLALADAIETTNVYDDINNSELTQKDCNSIKQYVRAKLLKVFSKFEITEIDSKFNWANTQSDGDAKPDIQALITKLREDFGKYKEILASDKNPEKVSNEEINTLWKYTQDFLLETNNYYYALEKLDLESFNAAKFEYRDYNNQAPLYITKIKQYLTITLPEFLDEINVILY